MRWCDTGATTQSIADAGDRVGGRDAREAGATSKGVSAEARLVTESGIVTLARLLHPLKAPGPMLVTESVIVTLARLLQP